MCLMLGWDEILIETWLKYIKNGVVNSLAPGRSYCDFKNVISNFALLIGIFKSFYDNVLR